MVNVSCDCLKHQYFVARQIELDACNTLCSSQRTVEVNFSLCRELALVFFFDLKREPVTKEFDTHFF